MKNQDELTRAQGSLTFISDSGLIPTAEEYKQRNSALIEAQKAQLEAQQAWADLAEQLEPLSTKITGKTTAFVMALTEGVARLMNMLSGPEGAKQELETYSPEFAEALENGQLDSFGGTLDYIWQSIFGGSGKESKNLPNLLEDPNLEVTITPTPTEDPEVNEAFEGLGASNGASYDQGLNAAMSSAIENAKISGVNVGVSIGNGITEATPGAVAAANALVDSVNEALSGLTGGINLGVGGYTAGNLTANLNIDGRRFGQYTSPIISNYLGQSASRSQKIG